MCRRVFRYLRSTKNLEIIYKGETNDLVGYADASLADYKNTLTSCGYLIRLIGYLVVWRTQKRPYMALAPGDAR